MDCQGFRSRHLDYTEGTLDDATLVACERHRAECSTCAALDTRVRRSLMICHSVEPTTHRCDLTERVLQSVRRDRALALRRQRVASWIGGCAVCVLAVAAFLETTPEPLTEAAPARRMVAVEEPTGLPVVGPMEPIQWVDDSTDREEHPSAATWQPSAVTAPSAAGFLSVSYTAP